jgi:alanine dehydrogenase
MKSNAPAITGSLIICKDEVTRLLKIDACMEAVEDAFKLYALGKAMPPKVLGIHVRDGGFHIKAGVMNLGRNYFVAKTNANFPGNPAKNNLPTIQGVVLVCDADDGQILAIMDSIEITIVRTGAATGIAAKYLARKDSKIATICGCGNQGRISLKAILSVFCLEKVYAYDIDAAKRKAFADDLSSEFGISIIPVDDLKEATKVSDICVTCTTSKKAFLGNADVKPGTFIAAVGADSEDKQELEPSLLASGKIVTDVTEQGASFGELHHALEKGLLSMNTVHAELGEIIAGIKPGRTSDEEIIIFDSTGMALQDVAAASIVYEKAIKEGIGLKVNFAN